MAVSWNCFFVPDCFAGIGIEIEMHACVSDLFIPILIITRDFESRFDVLELPGN